VNLFLRKCLLANVRKRENAHRMELTPLQKKRLQFKPAIPEIFADLNAVVLKEIPEEGKRPPASLAKLFPKTNAFHPNVLQRGMGQKKPLKIGAIFSGGPASGGHNVLGGIFHAIKAFDSTSRLYGFLNGPSGIIGNLKRELSEKEIQAVFNQGGFDLIGTGRTKIETPEQLAASMNACKEVDLDGLVIIGGDDSNTNAAILAEYFLTGGCKTRVVGVPKTIDGDLRSKDIEISFGFDSACRTYSEIIGNIARDAISTKKYYHFIKLMGRSASHITLECALSTRPNLAIIGEEGKSLSQIVGQIADLVCKRYEAGKEYGVILVPEGLIEFIPEIRLVVESLNRSIAQNPGDPVATLSKEEKALLSEMGEKIRSQLLLERDPHGNVRVSQIDTQGLLLGLVEKELKKRPGYKGTFSAQEHFLGYEGRCCFPTNFDANYSYSLGLLAALAVRDGLTGVICAIQNLKAPPASWKAKAVPIIQLMHLEVRKGKEKPVIEKSLVDLHSKPFLEFSRERKSWEIQDNYRTPGPVQFFGDSDLTNSFPIILS
jgi:pyrophosphate--fructose-6-phosphate 1-phosphotransferase